MLTPNEKNEDWKKVISKKAETSRAIEAALIANGWEKNSNYALGLWRKVINGRVELIFPKEEAFDYEVELYEMGISAELEQIRDALNARGQLYGLKMSFLYDCGWVASKDLFSKELVQKDEADLRFVCDYKTALAVELKLP